MTEETAMAQNGQVNVNWLTVNVPSVISILAVGVGIAMYIQASVSTLEETRTTFQSRKLEVDRSLTILNDKLEVLRDLPYRMKAAEDQALRTNQRMDTYLQTLGVKIDGVSDRVNGLSTKVEVLGQKIDILSDKPKPTTFSP